MTFTARPGGGATFPSTQFHPLAGRTILQIIPELDAGGAERTAVDVAAGLAHAGARALVATEGGRLVGELQAKGGVWIPFPAGDQEPLRHAGECRAGCARICLDENVAIVHARSRAPAWVALGPRAALNMPFVTTYHGSYAGRSSVKVLYNSVMARGDAVIANSALHGGSDPLGHPHARGRIRVIHRGTDLARCSRRPRSLPSGSRPCARPGGWRRTSASCSSPPASRAGRARRCWSKPPPSCGDRGLDDVRFVLAGDAGPGLLCEGARRADRHPALKDLVRRVGHCTDMPAAFLAASVVTVPSTEPEAFGRSAVEAQAMGAPVVVSDLGAVPETVLAPPAVAADERTGWRVPAGDADALADAIGARSRSGATRGTRSAPGLAPMWSNTSHSSAWWRARSTFMPPC